MANIFNIYPMSLDTDFTDFYVAINAVLGSGAVGGLRLYKWALVSAGTTVAGTVTLQTTSTVPVNKLAPIVVPASAAVGTIIAQDDLTYPIPLDDFKVTGLTATVTRLILWAK